MRIVLSLFDGMSCGQIALRELGVLYEKCYASEVDRFAIAQTQLNFPDTIQLGNVKKWRTWDIDWASVDLILAGSPCQGFSRAGKGLAFDDPRSVLFFEFVDILDHVRRHNPDVMFLLENVKMKMKYLGVISEAVGVMPVLINSSLVSAQSRKRYYWTNIRTRREGLFGELHADIPQPRDRGLLLTDIIEEEVAEKYLLRGKTLKRILAEFSGVNPDKAYCVAQKNNTTGFGNKRTMTVVTTHGALKNNQDKSSCIAGAGGHGAGNHSDMDLIVQLNPSRECGGVQPSIQHRVYDPAGKSPAHVVSVPSGSYAILQRGRGYNKGGVKESKSPTLTGNRFEDNNHLLCGNIRRLTPTECARLQTIPEWYRWSCSELQQYKMLGNGWTVEVIKHILGFLPAKK